VRGFDSSVTSSSADITVVVKSELIQEEFPSEEYIGERVGVIEESSEVSNSNKHSL